MPGLEYTPDAELEHVFSILNSTTAALGISGVFTGTWEDVNLFQGIQTFVYFEHAPTSVVVQWSEDGINAIASREQPIEVALSITVGIYTGILSLPAMSGRYFRIKVTNNAVAQAYMGVSAWLLNSSYSGIYKALNSTLPDYEAALIVKSVGAGQNPDGVFQNIVIGGTKTLSPTPTPLGGGGTYTSQWIDTDHYPSIRLLVASDQASATGGVQFQWSDTYNGAVVRSTQSFTFHLGESANGRLILTETRARYLRIVYTNGVTAQTRFFLNIRLGPVPVVREVAIQTLSEGSTGQMDVGTVSTQALLPVLTNRKALRLKNLVTSARSLFFGFSSGVTTADGDGLGPGESVEMDLDEFVGIWVITTSTAGAGVRCSWSQLA